MIMTELASYGKGLIQTPMIAVVTKMDLPENQAATRELKSVLEKQGHSVHEISAVTGRGVKELPRHTAQLLKQIRRVP